MKKVAVVILNWNGKSFLEKFLPSVIKYSADDADIIIVDNASTDDSLEFLSNNYPDLRVIKIGINQGYAGGYNYSLSLIDATYFVLLNTDIEVTEGWIKPIVKLMDEDETIAACQPKILSYYDKNKFEYAGAAGGFIDKFGYPFCRGRLFHSLEEDTGQYDDVIDIFWASGASLFIRAEYFMLAGGFDNDFFAHMEEIDLCWRLLNLNFRIVYCPDSVVYHIGGGTLPKASYLKTYLNFRNNIVLLFKNSPKKNLIPLFTIKLILDGVAAFKFLFDGGIKHFWAVARAHFYFYSTFSKQRAKRKLILQSKSLKQIYTKSIVIDYYLKRKKKYSSLSHTTSS